MDIQGITHLGVGLFTGAVAGVAFGGDLPGFFAGTIIGGVTAIFPDVDHPGSMAGRVFRSLSLYLEERWGHRDSPTHTAAFVFLASLPCVMALFLTGCQAGLLMTAPLGGTSHLVLDSRTRSGVRPWRYLPVGEKWRNKIYKGAMETGKSPLEWAIAWAGFSGTAILSAFKLSGLI